MRPILCVAVAVAVLTGEKLAKQKRSAKAFMGSEVPILFQ